MEYVHTSENYVYGDLTRRDGHMRTNSNPVADQELRNTEGPRIGMRPRLERRPGSGGHRLTAPTCHCHRVKSSTALIKAQAGRAITI